MTPSATAEARADGTRGPNAVVIALGLALGPAVALGFARFAYALVLPAMRADLAWSYAVAGGLNTANAVGYLAGALLADTFAKLVGGTRRAFVWGMVITCLSLAAMATLRDLSALSVLRLVAGVSGAVVFVTGATLATHLAAARGKPGNLVVGIFFGGAGLGILLSGVSLPYLVPSARPETWPTAWWLMAGCSAVLTVVAAWAATRVAEPTAARGSSLGLGAALRAIAPLRFAMLAYLLFGLGYIGYMTFLVAFLQDAGRGAGSVAVAWGIIGLAAALHVFLWEWLFKRLRLGVALALAVGMLAVGAGLPLAAQGNLTMMVSGTLFGLSFLAIVSAITVFVRRTLPPDAWRATIGLATVVFALGQAAGPVVTGVLADIAGGLDAGLAVSAGCLALAVPVALLQRSPAPAAPAVPAVADPGRS